MKTYPNNLLRSLRLTGIILLLGLTSCKRENKPDTLPQQENMLEIPLSPVTDNEFQFNDIYFVDFPVYTHKKAFPKMYSEKLAHMKNIPEYDSLLMVSTDMQSMPRDYNQYVNGYMEQGTYLDRYADRLNDTSLILANGGIRYQMNAISIFSGNRQLLIPDLDSDNDFGNDPTLVFPRDFAQVNYNSPENIDTLPLLDFKYQLLINGNVHNITRKIQLFPSANHNHAYLLDDYLDDTLNEHTLMLRLKDYYKGHIKRDGKSYTVAVQGKNELISIVIKPDDFYYSSSNLDMQKFVEHKVGDTLKLGSQWYKIKNVAPDCSKLSLIESTIAPATGTGLQLGREVGDQALKGIDGVSANLYEKMEGKEFMLLDFWGTWCAPCTMLTPRLLQMHKTYGDNMAFVGVALLYQGNLAEVKDYVARHKMDWYHAYVDYDLGSDHIIRKLNISSFPTFMLLDGKGKMIFIGGSESLDDIEHIIKNNDKK